MLDKIVCVSNGDGTFNMTVSHLVLITDATSQINALQAQIIDMQMGTQTQDIIDTISNYQSAITILQGS